MLNSSVVIVLLHCTTNPSFDEGDASLQASAGFNTDFWLIDV
jgi:hypothetical protein